VGDLTLGQRQMVEIARATLDTDLRLLILDEPTESLTRDTTAKLYAYVAKVAEEGVAVLLISHRIQEVLASVDRVVVLKDGHVTSTHPVEGLTEDAVLTAMGGSLAAPVAVTDDTMGMPVEGKGDVVATLAARTARTGDPYEMRIREGEVVGLAGIAGQGQEEILQRLWKGSSRDDTVSASRAFVPGDRQKSGILPLWTVGENLGVTAMRTLSKLGLRDREAEQRTISEWVDALRIKGGADALMTGLSGGNQQKVIVARAFASSAEIVLLDDPFRGVDVHTKTDLYALIRREAANGRTIVWYSSENAEMRHCDRVYVLRAGRVAAELKGNQISEDRIISESFADVSEEAAA
jgi:ribose transport system ATP-binding protein